jgi:seryl-tRNA synthetase
MASPETMKKDELVSEYRKLTQELKRLLAENEELKKKSDNTVSSIDALNFDSAALAIQANDNKEFEVHILDYDSKAGQGVIKNKSIFTAKHMAEFDAKKHLYETLFKGVRL